VENMVNLLYKMHSVLRIELCWASNFIQQQLELWTYLLRPYNYQKVKCEDLEIIHMWFNHFRNTVAKHEILKSDIWNFDETEFLMGQILFTLIVTLSKGYEKVKKI